jgi:hypothetical protein
MSLGIGVEVVVVVGDIGLVPRTLTLLEQDLMVFGLRHG